MFAVSWPKTWMLPLLGLIEPDDRAQQHGLARSRAADNAHHFAAHDIEIDVIVNDPLAEGIDEAADADDDVVFLSRFAPIVTSPASRTGPRTPHRRR